MPKVDPITFAVVRNKLISIAKGMLEIAFRTGVSTYMYEIRDCSFAILDADASLVAQSDGILLFLSSLGPATKNCIDYIGKENLEPGDVIIANVPQIAGNHTCDVLLFVPVFYKGKLFGYTTSKAHWVDIGAKSNYPSNATNIYEEGLRVPPLKLYRGGKLQSEVWEIIKWNTRGPELVWGDMQAQIAACRLGEKQVVESLDKFGVEVVDKVVKEMYDHNERMTRLAIEKIPDGTYTAEDYMDSNGIDLDKPIPIKVTVTIEGSDITIDLSGSAPEQRGPMNSLWITTVSAARMSVKALTSPDLPVNEGFTRPIRVVAPEGFVYNAGPMAPVWLCGTVAETILELVNKALYQALPEKVPACSGGTVIGNGFFGVNPRTGRFWATHVPCIIGQGGDFYSDGENYLIHHAVAGCRNIPVEILESSFPLFVERHELIRDGGGPGNHRGGSGSLMEIRVLFPAEFFCYIEKATTPHWGVFGGKEGFTNYVIVKSKDRGEFKVLKASGVQLSEGDRVTIVAGGGGGYGDPLERDPENVRWDVINGYVSVEQAKLDYGVAINGNTFDVSVEATEELRKRQQK